MTADTYNGWTNRETWALNLWLMNDQGLYDLTRERVTEAVAAVNRPGGPTAPGEIERAFRYQAGLAVKALWEELTDPDEGLMSAEAILPMVRDIGSEYRVDWDEIGAYWISDLDES